jgi:hypothetical protein
MPGTPIYNLPSLVGATAEQLFTDNVGLIVGMVVAVVIVALVTGWLRRIGGGV